MNDCRWSLFNCFYLSYKKLIVHLFLFYTLENFEFSQGLKKWEEERRKWLKKPINAPQEETARGAIDLDVDEVIDLLFSNRWRQTEKGPRTGSTFSQAIPLPQMIDILVDLWEAEGLDA